MGATHQIKQVLVFKGITAVQLAEKHGDLTQTFYNKLQRDTMRYSEVQAIADLLDCDVVFKDRQTGREFYAK